MRVLLDHSGKDVMVVHLSKNLQEHVRNVTSFLKLLQMMEINYTAKSGIRESTAHYVHTARTRKSIDNVSVSVMHVTGRKDVKEKRELVWCWAGGKSTLVHFLIL